MSEPKHLSNKELVDELISLDNPTGSLEEQQRKSVLIREVLRRLNEPWRVVKDE